jgi:hypothetical protein
MNILKSLIPPAYAAPIDLGPITGTGTFQNITGSPQQQLSDFLSSLITTITVVGSLAFVVYFTIGGLKWIVAGGDKAKVAEAQSQMTQAALGLIAIVASFFIVGIVGSVLGIDVLRPFATLFPSK